MPKTRPLTAAQRKLQKDMAARTAFLEAVAVYKVRTGTRDQDITDSLGVDRGILSRMKRNPLNARLADIRSVAQQIKMEPETWLLLGGFPPRPASETRAAR